MPGGSSAVSSHVVTAWRAGLGTINAWAVGAVTVDPGHRRRRPGNASIAAMAKSTAPGAGRPAYRADRARAVGGDTASENIEFGIGQRRSPQRIARASSCGARRPRHDVNRCRRRRRRAIICQSTLGLSHRRAWRHRTLAAPCCPQHADTACTQSSRFATPPARPSA